MTREEMDEAVRIAQRVLPVLERVQRARVAHGRSDDDWNERELFVLALAVLALAPVVEVAERYADTARELRVLARRGATSLAVCADHDRAHRDLIAAIAALRSGAKGVG